jgi:hypothetical protein
MKITASDETITVDGWLRNKFQARAREITDVRVMADKAVPAGYWDRLKRALGRARPEMTLRAVIVWAGDRAITLDACHDKGFDSAVAWLKRQGWDIESGVANAIKTPFVRVPVNRHR